MHDVHQNIDIGAPPVTHVIDSVFNIYSIILANPSFIMDLNG